MKKLIISDLDGTLLDSDGNLSESQRDFINDLIEEGYYFSVATGRMFSAARKPLKGLDIRLPMVTLNGCYIAEPEILHTGLSNDLMCDLYEGVAGIKASVVLMQRDKAFLKGEEYMPTQSLHSWVANIKIVAELERGHCSDTTLVLINGDEKVILEFHEQAEKVSGDRADVFSFPSIRYPPMWYLEIRAKYTNKGTAVARLIEHIDIDESDVIILGDYYNDIEMFDHAGMKGAPSNAVDEIKEKADFVSDKSNDEEAVMDILKRLL